MILSTGSYLPARVVPNEEFAESLDTSDEWIRTRTGIRERRYAGPAETTSPLSINAVANVRSRRRERLSRLKESEY